MLGKKGKKVSENTPAKSAEEFTKNLPPIARKYGFRVSRPYGYFHEDVDNLIMKLEDEINNLTKENKTLSDDLDRTKDELKDVKSEFSRYRMQISFMPFGEKSEEEEIDQINGIKDINANNKPSIKIKPAKTDIKATSTSDPNKEKKSTFNNLIRPKQDTNGG